MKKAKRVLIAVAAAFAALILLGGATTTADAGWRSTDADLVRSLPGRFDNGYADVNGVRLHYVDGGSGSPIVLLPGWPETWWAFHKVMPALAAHHRVLAVDLRGMGGSAKPDAGYDKKTMAADIHALVTKLGYAKADIVGHDIGAMVAHSYALNFPEATGKLALMDVVHPDESLYGLPLLPVPGQFYPWWWAFNQVHSLPEQLVSGRSRQLVDTMINQLARVPGAVTDRDRDVYARAYATPEAIRAGNGWYQALGQDIADSKAYGRLTVPLLGVASEDNFPYFQMVLPAKATEFQVVKIDGSGHYVAEEQPDAVARTLNEFFG